MPIHTLVDHGAALYDAESDTAYCRVSPDPSQGVPDWLPGPYDVTNISGVEFNYDTEGDTSAEWSPCERAVACNVDAMHDEIYVTGDMVSTAPHFYTTPRAGELRAYVHMPNWDKVPEYKITLTPSESGLHIDSYAHNRLDQSRGIILPGDAPLFLTAPGDDVLHSSQTGRTVRVFFRPAIWP